jgi:hypothetical protein
MVVILIVVMTVSTSDNQQDRNLKTSCSFRGAGGWRRAQTQVEQLDYPPVRWVDPQLVQARHG